MVVTDSGGLQEEAPALGKPVLVLRQLTERPEAVKAGTVRLVGTDSRRIHRWVTRLLDDSIQYRRMANAVNPYGDGRAADRTAEAIRYFLHLRRTRPAEFQVAIVNFLFPYLARWRTVNWTRYHQLFTRLADRGHDVYVLQPPASNMPETNFQEIEVEVPGACT